jgi:hypothetical protein
MFLKKHWEDTQSAITNNLITIQKIVNLSLKPQLIPNKIVICKGENGGIYSRITDKGPKKGKDQLTVKVH